MEGFGYSWSWYIAAQKQAGKFFYRWQQTEEANRGNRRYCKIGQALRWSKATICNRVMVYCLAAMPPEHDLSPTAQNLSVCSIRC